MASQRETVPGSLRRLHEQMDRAAEIDRHWRAVDVLADTLSGLGYLVLGTAIPVLASIGVLTWRSTIISLVPSLVLAYLGFRLLQAAIALKSHFVSHEDHLADFLKVFEDDVQFGPALKAWLATPEVRSTSLPRHIRSVVVAVQANVAVLGSFLLAFLALYFFLAFLLALHSVGLVGAIIVMVALLAAIVLEVWLILRIGSRKPAKLLSPEGT